MFEKKGEKRIKETMHKVLNLLVFYHLLLDDMCHQFVGCMLVC